MKRYPISFLLLLALLSACIGTSSPLPASSPSATDSPAPTATVTSTVTPSPTRVPESVDFYHIRIEYQTTSDWSVLSLLRPENVLAVRLLETLGEAAQPMAELSELVLGQPLAAAEAGLAAGMMVDYALKPEARQNLFEFEITKGDIGGSTVNVYLVSNGEQILVQSASHFNNVANSDGRNPMRFSLDLNSMDDSAISTNQIHSLVHEKMVWAFYYAWYKANDWSSAMLKDRPVIRYDSMDGTAITRHIEQAQAAGIDGFITSWWGPDSPDTEPILGTLLDEALRKNFKIAIYFETLAGPEGSPLEEGEILRWLDYLIRKYSDHPAWYKVDGKPVIVIWASGTVSLETWERIFTTLRENGLDAIYLSMGFNLRDLRVFDGFHEYGVFQDPDLAETNLSTGRAVRYAALLEDEPRPKIWITTVQPGYDDTLLPGREGLVKEREDGAFYRFTFEAALQSNPDWIFITSWNEWWEHTHIEPGEVFGDLYLEITREYVDLWKSR